MNPLTAQLANQHISDMRRAASQARIARQAHDARPHLRRTRRTG
jgi:hypothetical protein